MDVVAAADTRFSKAVDCPRISATTGPDIEVKVTQTK